MHNLFGYAWWKLGVVGGGLVIGLAVFLVRHIRLSLRMGDRLGVLVGGVLTMWLLHGMVNMDFTRSEVNLLVAASIAYFLARTLWAGTFFGPRQASVSGS